MVRHSVIFMSVIFSAVKILKSCVAAKLRTDAVITLNRGKFSYISVGKLFDGPTFIPNGAYSGLDPARRGSKSLKDVVGLAAVLGSVVGVGRGCSARQSANYDDEDSSTPTDRQTDRQTHGRQSLAIPALAPTWRGRETNRSQEFTALKAKTSNQSLFHYVRYRNTQKQPLIALSSRAI